MPFLTDEDIESRLTSPDNLVSRMKIHECGKGHGNKTPVPQEIKQVIAELGNDGVKGVDLSREFGISQSLVSQTVNGNNSVGFRDPALYGVVQNKRKEVEGKRAQAEESAIDAVIESLGLLSGQIAEVKKPKELASIARDMASVAEKIRGRSIVDGEKQVHLHLYAPKMKKVEDYEIIDV